MGGEFDSSRIRWVPGKYGLPEAWYKLKVPSVTAIINDMIPDPDLDKWTKEVGEEKAKQIMEAAGHRGTAMHTFIENFMGVFKISSDPSEALKHTQSQSPLILEKEQIPTNKIDEGRNLFYKFYYSDYPIQYKEVIGLELGIYSQSLLYRGKLDIFYKDRLFGPAVTDFKTSNGYIKKGSIKEIKHKNQLGAYANALDEMYNGKVTINKASILCVNTNTDALQEISCDGKELQKYKEEFKTLCLEYHRKNKSS